MSVSFEHLHYCSFTLLHFCLSLRASLARLSLTCVPVPPQAVFAAYAECAEDALGLLLAERLARMGLQPFNTATVLRAGRQVEVLVHHARLWSRALAAPLPRLPRTTRVLAAMCGAGAREDFFSHMFGTAPEEADPQHVRDFYGANLAAEIHCEGSHLEVGVRCATNRDPEFVARLASFLHTLALEAADGGGGAAGSSLAGDTDSDAGYETVSEGADTDTDAE